MKVSLVLAALAAALVVVAPVGARPPGATKVEPYVLGNGIIQYNTVDSSGVCSLFDPIVISNIATSGQSLTATVHGWIGAPYELPGSPQYGEQVHLKADVQGTVVDAAGNVYQADGHFLDDTVHTIGTDVAYDGTGQITLKGPAGVIKGDATFRFVSDPPVELDVSFTDANVCRTK